MLKDVRKGTCDKQLEISWEMRDAQGELKMQCNCPEPFDFYIGTCPDNPADKEMSCLILRRKDQNVEWCNTILVRGSK